MKITNQKAFFDYELLDRIEAGINLTGAEVKAVRQGKADLSGSFVKVSGSEAYLVNAKIFPYEFARTEGYDPNRTRKLLLHKKELLALRAKTEGENLTIMPVSLYTTKTFIKAQLAIARSKRKFDKREAIKKRDRQRDLEASLTDDSLL
ncbi:MAG: SsrA-binding protein SmpB [Candidatus Levybacteria bacterium]|nr:SsrA-binding protein SmpB [Candidatus Levybacteria bacterium]